MSKPVVYIAGPYRGKSESDVFKHIINARKWAIIVWTGGGIAICPHLNTAFFGGVAGLPDQVWLDGDLEIIKRCDAVLVIPASESSVGTQAEIQHAERQGIPVFHSTQSLFNWMNARSFRDQPSTTHA